MEEEKTLESGYGSRTKSNYYNYEYSKKHSARAKKATRILTVAFALLMLGNGIYNTVGVFQTKDKLASTESEIAMIENKMRRLDKDSREYENYASQLELMNEQKEIYNRIKTLDIVGASGSAAVVAALLYLRSFLEKLIENETDERKRKFYRAFLEEIVFINSERSFDSLDYIISYVISDAAKGEGMSFDDMMSKINEEEVFPEYESKYTNILAFMDEYLKTHDYARINPEVNKYLPLNYIQFAAFLKKKGLAVTQFRLVPYDEAISLMEEYLGQLLPEEEKTPKNKKYIGRSGKNKDDEVEPDGMGSIK